MIPFAPLAVLNMVPKWALVAAIAGTTGYGLYERNARVGALERLADAQSALTNHERAQASAAVLRREREIEREDLAQKAANVFVEELAALRSVVDRPPVGLRHEIRTFNARGPGDAPVSAQCRGAEDRAATLGDLLEQSDQLLVEGRQLSRELAFAAETHASEARALKSRALSDRLPE